MSFSNRIVESGTVEPKKLKPNPKNWRKHPEYQESVMAGVLDEIGWIRDIIVNKRTGNLVDGHLRLEIALKNKEESVPVKYVDLSEEEENKAMLTFDPIGAMIEADQEALRELMEDVELESEIVEKLLEDMRDQYGIADDIPEIHNEVEGTSPVSGEYARKSMPIIIGKLIVFKHIDEPIEYDDKTTDSDHFNVFFEEGINENEKAKELMKKFAARVADEIRNIM